MKKTARFYAENPKSAARKRAYQREYNKSEDQKKYRAELNAYNRKAQAAGKANKGDKLDASHRGSKIVGFESQSKNRGSKSNSAGDRRVRGR